MQECAGDDGGVVPVSAAHFSLIMLPLIDPPGQPMEPLQATETPQQPNDAFTGRLTHSWISHLTRPEWESHRARTITARNIHIRHGRIGQSHDIKTLDSALLTGRDSLEQPLEPGAMPKPSPHVHSEPVSNHWALISEYLRISHPISSHILARREPGSKTALSSAR